MPGLPVLVRSISMTGTHAARALLVAARSGSFSRGVSTIRSHFLAIKSSTSLTCLLVSLLATVWMYAYVAARFLASARILSDSAVRQGLLSSLWEKPMRCFAFLPGWAGVWLGLHAAITARALNGSRALAAAAALRPSPAAARRKSKRLILPA